ncbi:MAG: hypothetical protein NC311_00820 [Muribaculaceae bacterium]|nr:hypothetical protein [Muribaculaceae bacterium]
MRFVFISLFILTTLSWNAHGAEIVKFGATLCPTGQHMSNGICIDLSYERCPSGFHQSLIGASTFSAPSIAQRNCMNAYNPFTMPDEFYAIYNGVLVSFGATLCDENSQFGGGACAERVQGRCPDGQYQTLIGANTFSSPTAELNECMNSYNQYEMPDVWSAIYNGVLVNFGATLCGAGQYLSDGACVSRDRGDCPDSFYDITVSDTTMMPRENASCASGYSSFWLAANCASGDVQNNMCAVLCDAGLSYSGTGACVAMCSVNAGRNVTLNMPGRSLPLYAVRNTTPALGVATSNGGVCYGNLVPGTMRGAINVTVSGKNYYISD